MKRLIISIIVLLGSATALFSQIDACLIEPVDGMPIDYTYYDEWESLIYNVNLDSVLLDTCNSYPGHWVIYGQYFNCYLTMNIFPRDTIYGYDVNHIDYTLDDLPPQYQYLYDELDSIRKMFGDFVFRDDDLRSADTTEILTKRFLLLVFTEYNNRDSVVSKLNGYSVFDHIYLQTSLGTVVSIKDNKENDSIYIFPNPTNEILYVESTAQIETLKVVDITGIEIKQIKGPNIEQINVRELPIGTYILIINNKYIHKFIKE
jgi:hypothetical protein